MTTPSSFSILLLLLLMPVVTNGEYSMQSEQEILNALLKNYDMRVRPPPANSSTEGAVNVRVNIMIRMLSKIDVVNMVSWIRNKNVNLNKNNIKKFPKKSQYQKNTKKNYFSQVFIIFFGSSISILKKHQNLKFVLEQKKLLISIIIIGDKKSNSSSYKNPFFTPKFQEYSIQLTFREQWIDPRLAYENLGFYNPPAFLTVPHVKKSLWIPDTFFPVSLIFTLKLKLEFSDRKSSS